MARPARASRTAPAAAKMASSVAVTAGKRIDQFGRISKCVAPSAAKKTAVTATPVAASRREAATQLFAGKETKETKKESHSHVQPAAAAAASPVRGSRKRRAVEDVDEPSALQQQQPGPVKRVRRAKTKTTTTTTSSSRSIADLLTRTTAAAAPQAVDSASDSDGDHRGSLYLARLQLAGGGPTSTLPASAATAASVPPSPPASTASSPRPASTAPTTPCASESEGEAEDGAENGVAAAAAVSLPSALLDLVRLQAAFVKALALHHAHHGAHAPVDLGVLCPSVAQAWGKRRVAVEDVRRCLGVAAGEGQGGDDQQSFFLSDYGRGKICIEVPAAVTGPTSTLVEQLNPAFEANLRARWARWAAAAAGGGLADTEAFIAALPQKPITPCASLRQTSALRAKGQRTLEELMRGIALKKQEKEAQEALLKAPAVVEETEAMEVDAPKAGTAVSSAGQAASTATSSAPPMNLLDRIRFRQLQRAQLQASGQLAAPPTPEELERRAALHRACDIGEVLAMLCAAGRQSGRVSLGMTAVVGKIKDSLRRPMAREEAAACVRLLAQEVAPQWLQLVSLGGREIVIMMADRVPSQAAIQSRVQSLMQ